MSNISYPQLVKNIADAYRTASKTTEKVKYGELASKISDLSSVQPQGEIEITENGEYDVTEYATASVNVRGSGAKASVNTLPEIVANASLTPTATIKRFITNSSAFLTGGTFDTEAVVGDVLGVASNDININKTTKQWQRIAQHPISGTENFNNYSKNSPAQAAYKSINYDAQTTINTIVHKGSMIGWERIGYVLTLSAGQSVIFDMKYKSEVAVGSSGYEPHAPFIYIGAPSVLNVPSHLYGSSSIYSSVILPVSAMSDYQQFSCFYKNTTTQNMEVAIGLDTGSTADNVERTFYVKDAILYRAEFADIAGATSETYTVQTGDNAIRCLLTGVDDYLGELPTSTITIREE